MSMNKHTPNNSNNMDGNIVYDNVMVTAYIYADDNRVEFDKKAIGGVLDNHSSIKKSEYRDKIPKNTRIYTDEYNVISLSSKSIIARESSVKRCKQAIRHVINAMDDLDDDNNLSDLWRIEYNISSIASRYESDKYIDLYKSKSILENYYEHVTYHEQGYLQLHTADGGDVFLYESGKISIKGGKSESEVEEKTSRLTRMITDGILDTIDPDIYEIKNSDSDINKQWLDNHDLSDLNL